MTLDEIRKSDAVLLTIEDIAGALNISPQTIRAQAHDDPDRLGFATIQVKSRVYIPREPFLHFMHYGRAPIMAGEHNAQDN